ncbi:glycoside hydrolase family 125 protein [soil metagenome]
MSHRRTFIKTTSLASIALAAGLPSKAFMAPPPFVSNRPEPSKRKFTSKAVEQTILKVKKAMADEELAWLFENCFPNTLDTTVTYTEQNMRPSTYVITGDIDAMWLRDSSAQVWPYLPLAKEDEALKKLLKGVINKQSEFVLLDPYANAFYNDSSRTSEWKDDHTTMKPGIHERKWEIDSLCYVIRLSAGYYAHTQDTTAFGHQWQDAMKLIVQTFREQQRKENNGPYSFQRTASNPTDTQFGNGYGNPTKKIGLIHSMFRPSDDATVFPLLVSSNMFAAVSLRQLGVIFGTVLGNLSMETECNLFASELEAALKKYAILEHPTNGKLYPLEIDGFGNALFMDDANIPNLLSLPYLGYCQATDPIYINTRKFSLSHANPWFNEGRFAKGIGGPHVGEKKIWPMGLIMQALTSSDDEEIIYCLQTLKRTHAGTGFIHESFNIDNPKDFSRNWFAWANTLFGELILHLYETKPGLLKRGL